MWENDVGFFDYYFQVNNNSNFIWILVFRVLQRCISNRVQYVVVNFCIFFYYCLCVDIVVFGEVIVIIYFIYNFFFVRRCKKMK